MAKRDRLIQIDAHRPVAWNESAVLRCIERSGYVLAQVKEDGIRIHAWLDQAGNVRIVTREGIEILSLVHAKEALRSVLEAAGSGFMVDGEVTVPGVTFEEASGHVRRHSAIEVPVQFYLWDLMPLSAACGMDTYEVAYDVRLSDLIRVWNDCAPTPGVEVIGCEPCYTMQELQAWYELQRSLGKEGLVAKDPALEVINGKRTGQWKMKPSDTCDGQIRGYVWGTPGLGNAGLIVGFTVELEDGTLCDATGLTKAQMQEYTRGYNSHRESYIGRYVEVAYMEKTASGSLRHPSFVRFRDMEYAPGIKA